MANWEVFQTKRSNRIYFILSSNKKNSKDNYDGVDQLTWDDLSMNKVFQKLNYTQTTVGSEYLFNQLREIDPSLEHIQEDENL